MTVSIHPSTDAGPANAVPGDFAVVLGDVTAALARGELADGTRLMERALLLDVRWEQLTTAVWQGIEQGYEHREAAKPR